MSSVRFYGHTLSFVLLATLIIASGTALAQNTINVPADQPSIQAGINAANNGDTVLVAPGTYPENINFMGKLITVTSSGGPSVTIIDGGGIASVVTFNTGETTSAVIKGFTIQNGNGNNSIGEGGGVLADQASPTISGNIIQDNVACGGGGGGIGTFGSNVSPVIQNNIIRNNGTSPAPGCFAADGGGILIEGTGSAQIIGNTIINNSTAGFGGGITLYAAGAPTVTNNVISGNVVLASSFFLTQGGGIYLVGVSDAVIAQNLIYNNSAPQGGGIFLSTLANVRGPIIVNNTMFNDSSTNQGSEVYAQTSDGQVQFFNNLMIAPAGQNAAYCDSADSGLPSTFSNNDAFSVNGTGLAGICAGQSGQNGNISVDPLFVNASAGDFHLQSSSPAIDVGNNTAPSLPATDYVGNPRILDGKNDCVSVVDLGAYEFLAQRANVSFSPAQLTFPSEVIGFPSNQQTATLTNSGAGCFQISNAQMTGDFSTFTVNNCSLNLNLPGGSSCSYGISFTPTASGARTGAFTISGTDGFTKSAPSVSLGGTGLTPPAVSLSTNSLNFGSQPVGSSSAQQTVTVTNTGQASLSIATITVTAPFSETSSTCPSVLGGAASCVVGVTFAPSVAGAQAGALSFSDNAAGSPQTVALSGTGIDFSVSASPTSATVKHGSSVQFTIHVNPAGGAFNSSVALSCSNLPASSSCSLSPVSVVPGANGASSTLKVSTSGKTPHGTFNVLVTGKSGSLQHSATITLTVN